MVLEITRIGYEGVREQIGIVLLGEVQKILQESEERLRVILGIGKRLERLPKHDQRVSRFRIQLGFCQLLVNLNEALRHHARTRCLGQVEIFGEFAPVVDPRFTVLVDDLRPIDDRLRGWPPTIALREGVSRQSLLDKVAADRRLLFEIGWHQSIKMSSGRVGFVSGS